MKNHWLNKSKNKNGIIDDFKSYGRVLSREEIKEWMERQTMKNQWLARIAGKTKKLTLLDGTVTHIIPGDIKELVPCCHGSQIILKNGNIYSVRETYNLARKIIWGCANVSKSLVREGSAKESRTER